MVARGRCGRGAVKSCSTWHRQGPSCVWVWGGPMWAATAPTKLFEGRYGPPTAYHYGRTYDVSPDGRRFLMIKNSAASDPSAPPDSMVVVINWTEELKRLVPRR